MESFLSHFGTPQYSFFFISPREKKRKFRISYREISSFLGILTIISITLHLLLITKSIREKKVNEYEFIRNIRKKI